MASPLVKVVHLVFIRCNKNRFYTEKVKYPLNVRYKTRNAPGHEHTYHMYIR